MRKALNCFYVIGIILLLGATGIVYAESAATSDNELSKQKVPAVNIDLSVPPSPAFTILGLNPETVAHPSTPRELALSLLSGFDRNGNLQSGWAIDTAPYLLLRGQELTLGEYRQSFITRVLSNTQLSLATAKASSSQDKAVRAALGLQVTIFNLGDPRLDTELDKGFKAVDDMHERQRPIPRPSPVGTPQKEIDKQRAAYEKALQEWDVAFEKDFDKEREKARRRNWNNSSWIIGIAPSWISDKAALDSLSWDGGGFWTTATYGFEGVKGLEDLAQLLLHIRYRNKEHVPVPDQDNKFFDQDTFLAGGGLRFGSVDFNASLDAAYVNARPNDMPRNNFWQLSINGELKVGNNQWLTVSFARDTGNRNNNKSSLLASFKWGFSDKPQLAFGQ